MKPYITFEAVQRLNEFNVELLSKQAASYRRQAATARTPIDRAAARGAAEALRKAAALLSLEGVQIAQTKEQAEATAAPGARIVTTLPTPAQIGGES